MILYYYYIILSIYIILINAKQNYKCNGGILDLPNELINDDYCDCLDGSDEQLTSACSPLGKFSCFKDQSVVISSSHVNDGICDCCDGSDERIGGICPDRCEELAFERQRIKEQHQIKLNKALLLKRDASNAAKRLIDEWRQRKIALEDVMTNHVETLYQLVERKLHEEKIRDRRMIEQQRVSWARNRARRYRLGNDKESTVKPTKQSRTIEIPSFKNLECLACIRAYLNETLLQNVTLTPRGLIPVTLHYYVYEYVRRLTKQAKLINQGSILASFLDDASWGTIFQYMLEFLGVAASPCRFIYDLTNWIFSRNSWVVPNVSFLPRPLVRGFFQWMAQNRLWVWWYHFWDAGPTLFFYLFGTIEEGDIEGSEIVPILQTVSNRLHEIVALGREELTKLDKKLSVNYGPNDMFMALYDQCISKKIGEYTYEICMFEKVSQDSLSLGSFDNFSVVDTDHSVVLRYSGGTSCWNAPARSTRVVITCDIEFQIHSVREPSTCQYDVVVGSPLVCEQDTEMKTIE